ncbi:MAG TPA: hypothetical protein VHG93_22065 [Longimicrobium sp.]|nr:hypothetical protein [Longimicrobium sp.]
MGTQCKALLCTLLVFLAACGGDAVMGSQPNAQRASFPTGASLTENCQTLRKDATPYSGSTVIQTDVDSIGNNCLVEMCGMGAKPVSMIFVQDGNNTNNNDQILYKCQSLSYPYAVSDWQDPWDSSNSCWNCVNGCATNCPTGYSCYPITGTDGTDCKPFKCDVSDGKAWRLVDVGYGVPPKCEVLDCPPPPLTISVDGPSSIRPGAECSWTATPGGGNGNPYSITWYVGGTSVGYGPYWTGSKPSGVYGSNWTLKAEVTDGSTATYTLHPISESSGAPICFS